jgi:hypothetical protein
VPEGGALKLTVNRLVAYPHNEIVDKMFVLPEKVRPEAEFITPTVRWVSYRTDVGKFPVGGFT